MDWLKRKLSSLVGPLWCILCWKAEEDLDHILWHCEFDTMVARFRDCKRNNRVFRGVVVERVSSEVIGLRLLMLAILGPTLGEMDILMSFSIILEVGNLVLFSIPCSSSSSVKNSRGDVLQCSHYLPIVSPEGKPLPCVIYCHGNSGCRADASEAAIILLPSNITVFALDFSGSGLSGGEHVTLGWNEKDDLKAVVEYLRADGNVSLIGLWGRSMGAVTSLMYGAEDPSIAGMVLDSPFSDLVELMMELVETYKFRLPKFTVKFAIQYMRRAIQKKAKFDIMDLNTIKGRGLLVPPPF
ncbi:uncharacterized protein E6C27_scaffold111G00920 [Cucumis melo var. makuwa]|uniref:Serine aminopeptidase S33 domain-containing protein n=1 Tax=Cucumis melo var. makuwa TaxID=1194695 RepID=A0A5A7SVU9_CUCMM|nr:uncharacterized protein E6C27_scaffold111G00920 [Cucumis melo var. makuwa]